jgi:hypothetical protein
MYNKCVEKYLGVLYQVRGTEQETEIKETICGFHN